MFWLEFAGIGVPCSTVVLIVLLSSSDSQTFTLVVRELAVSPSAKWFAPLFMFDGLSTGLLLSSSSYELSSVMANIWHRLSSLLLELEKIELPSSESSSPVFQVSVD
jgi:hypothetical protein